MGASIKVKARTKCPNCEEIVYEDCEACITGGVLMHSCGDDGEPEVYDVKWKRVGEEFSE